MVYVLVNWIGIEDIAIVTDTDGNTMTWGSYQQAYRYGKRNCQNFKAVKI